MEYTYDIEDFKNLEFDETSELDEKVLEFCSTLKSLEEICDFLGEEYSLESTKEIIDEMVDSGLLLLRFPKQIDHPKQKYKQNKVSKDETKQTKRVLELINRFNNGEKVCIDGLRQAAKEAYDFSGSVTDKLWFNESTTKPMSDKSVRRDLDIVKSHFPRAFELITTEKGCYKSLNRKMFDNFLNPEALSLMIQTFTIAQRNNMFDSFDISEEDKQILNKKAKEKSKVYEFKNKPFENVEKEKKYFHILEENIKNRKKLFIKYEENSGQVVDIEVKPYKIIFMNDNFYVGCAVDNDYLYSTYRISKILEIKEVGKRFDFDPRIEEYIKEGIQTPFSSYSQNYREKMIKVVLEVDKERAYHFKVKKHLTSQKIIEEKEDGSLLVGYLVTQEREMQELVKKWIPYVKVIEPETLKKSIVSELEYYLKSL